jgi:hypothetical protein
MMTATKLLNNLIEQIDEYEWFIGAFQERLSLLQDEKAALEATMGDNTAAVTLVRNYLAKHHPNGYNASNVVSGD